MRKRFIAPTPEAARPHGEGWLDINRTAVVEITSEEEGFPIESALVSGENRGWRAAVPGSQTVRLVFDKPQQIRRISLVVEEEQEPRTQEFVLRWSADGGHLFREIVRQQWNREVEEYQVEISAATELELVIVPDINGATARASLKSLRLR